MVINIVTIDGLIPGATIKKAGDGLVHITWKDQTHPFHESIIKNWQSGEISNETLVRLIKSQFEVTPPE